MVALVPVLVAAAVLPHRRALRPALRSAGIALAAAVGGFALSTPYFFLDWHTALDSLRAENTGPVRALGHSGLSQLGKLRWYLGTAIPETLTWPLVALAAAGIVVVVRRRRARQLLLVAFCAVFLAGICASTARWIRWVIPIVPVLVLFAAGTVDTITHRLATPITQRLRTSILAPVTLVAVTAVLALHPVGELLATNRWDNRPSISGTTRRAARNWIVTHLGPGSRILEDSDTLPLHRTRFDVDDQLNPRTHTLADYQHAGYQYLVVNGRDPGLYRFNAAYHPREAAFYLDVDCHARLIAAFSRTFLEQLRYGPPIRIYQLDEPPEKVSGYLCSQQVDS